MVRAAPSDCRTSRRYKSILSAYKEIFSVRGGNAMPSTSAAALSSTASGSIARAKRAGERGLPCLVPWWRGKEAERTPFVWTLDVGAKYSRRNHDIKLGPIPNLCKIRHKYSHYTEQKAFSASREATTLASPSAVELAITVSSLLRLMSVPLSSMKPV